MKIITVMDIIIMIIISILNIIAIAVLISKRCLLVATNPKPALNVDSQCTALSCTQTDGRRDWFLVQEAHTDDNDDDHDDDRDDKDTKFRQMENCFPLRRNNTAEISSSSHGKMSAI